MEVASDGMPVNHGVAHAAIIVMAMMPVGGMKARFVRAEDLLEALPCGRIRSSRKDKAIVEENCLNIGHAGVIVRRTRKLTERGRRRGRDEVFDTNELESWGE